MAKQEVLDSICDRCHKEVRQPMGSARRGTLALPLGWLHISGQSQTSIVFELDLCEDCKQIVLEAAGRSGRQGHLAVVS